MVHILLHSPVSPGNLSRGMRGGTSWSSNARDAPQFSHLSVVSVPLGLLIRRGEPFHWYLRALKNYVICLKMYLLCGYSPFHWCCAESVCSFTVFSPPPHLNIRPLLALPSPSLQYCTSIIGGRCHKYHFCHNKSFVMTNIFCRDKSILVVTKLLLQQILVMTKLCLSWQRFCGNKHTFVMTKDVFLSWKTALQKKHVRHDKLVTAEMMLLAAPARCTPLPPSHF